MKYLILFESFESNILSKMINFLNKKIDNTSKQKFEHKIKTLISQFDIPIDKINDKDIKYLNKNQAIKLRNIDNIDNNRGIYCLKFWFSIDDGYLGFTGVGNRSMDFKSYINNNKKRGDYLDNDELQYIKNELNIKTGKLVLVKNYNDLTHKQLVIGIFSDSEDNIAKLGLAKIWRDRYNKLNAIQNVSDGGIPSEYSINGESWTELRDNDSEPNEYGYVPFSLSWSMGTVNNPSSDHHKLHIYIPSEEPLHIHNYKIEKKEEEKQSPFDFNLPLNSDYNLRQWGDASWSIDDYKMIEKSDFSIILMIDDIIKSFETKVSDVRNKRLESKKGATKLINDDDIKKANIERYLTAMVSKMGIEKDVKELKNLQKLVIKSLCGDFIFISIYKNMGFNNLNTISHYIYEMIKSDNDSDRSYHLANITHNYKLLNSYYLEFNEKFENSLKLINDFNLESLKEIFKIFMRIGEKIKNYLLSQNIQTIEDLQMVQAKLKSIANLVSQKAFLFSCRPIKNILNEFQFNSDIKYYLNEININFENNLILEDIEKTKHIERYIDSLFR